MNPLFQQWGGAIVRLLMATGGAAMVTAWLVRHEFLTAAQIDELGVGLATLLATAGWSLWQKHVATRLTFTMGAMPKGTTLEEAKESIAAGVAAPSGTGAGDTPVLVKSVESVKPRGDSWLLPLLLASSLAAGSIALPACGGTIKPPVITGEDQVQVRQAATKALAGIEVAGVVVRDGMKLTNELRDARIIPSDVRESIASAVRAANDVVQQAITELAQATRMVTVDALVQRVTGAVVSVADLLERQTDARVQTAGRFLRTAVGAIGLLLNRDPAVQATGELVLISIGSASELGLVTGGVR